MFHFWRDVGERLTQRRWWSCDVLHGQFGKHASKRPFASQPFIDHYTQRILIAGRTHTSLYLFGSYVGDGAGGFLRDIGARILRNYGNAKIGEQKFIIASK